MHDTVRKWLEMGSKGRFLIETACRPEKKLGLVGVKFKCFSNLSSQISVLVKVTGIDLAKHRAAQLSASP
jgi:hypothetical protein